ncbi:OmpA family protein [Aquimarina sp. AU474]|uniref:OmpA family protein n=1 Tax=Aquimarina sp. AU474 TaxID=2108529 RepID=UPI000D691B91|nr:OmpA family protein [Aquimarina sp. AU474]
MKNFISFLIFLLFAWLAMWWYYSCDWCSKSESQNPGIVEEKLSPEAEALAKKAYDDSIAAIKNTSIGLSIKDNQNQDVFSYNENLQINNANGEVFVPSALNGFESQIADYLGANQDKELIITGYETSAEQSSGSNFGESRANFIKDLLIRAGINADRIVSKSDVNSYSYSNEGTYNGGISLNFNTLDESRLAEVEKSVANRTLYCEFAQKTFKPDATLSNYALELKNYLNKYPEKSVQIIGHTDDIGDNQANLWYGRQRAKNVKDYFISQGVAKEKMKISSKGESSPIAPNDSDANRAKNRRIEIIVN